MGTDGFQVSVPVFGDLRVPPPEHLVWYAAVGALVALECLEWPVAAIVVAGKALADNRHSRVLRELGEGLEDAG